MPKKSNTQDFITKAIAKHGNKYDYSKVDYKGKDIPITIICPVHGEFKQTPHNHLDGCGCPICYQERRGNSNRKKIESFISQAKKIHGDKYDYSESIYVNANHLMNIICPIHGAFQQRPSNHLKGQGCPQCGNAKKGLYAKGDTQSFVKKAIALHPSENFDYSLVDYKGNKSKVTIICPNGHKFNVRPNDFLMGHGCPICNQKLHITENSLYEKIKLLYSDAIHSYRPIWLHNKTSSQEIDIYIPSLRLGIEYQGQQHFVSRSIFGGDNALQKTKERDLRKYEKCKNNNVELFYVSYEKKVPLDYIAPIYTDYNSLMNAIQNRKQTMENTISLNENDIVQIVESIISHIQLP